MVEVAAAAGVSRQTLYNEFGSKDGLARALVRREADGYLAGVERALPRRGRRRRPGSGCAAAAAWTVRTAAPQPAGAGGAHRLLGERLPSPAPRRCRRGRPGGAGAAAAAPSRRWSAALRRLSGTLVWPRRGAAVALRP